ncbi:MAG: alkaline phosphatase [Clostridia bacterium]|nr:alkaline phosphatase [Clostridia bacterium]
MKRFAALFLTLTLLLSLCACGAPAEDNIPSVTTTTTATSTVPPITIPTVVGDGKPVTATLGGVNLAEYVIVYDEDAPDYTIRAALYIRDAILARTGAALTIVSDDAETGNPHEIVVGETNRPISAALDATREGLQFAYMAADGHVALEADSFVIAAAAYHFIETYITARDVAAVVPTAPQVATPIVKEAKNFLFLIGDGMGVVHTTMPERYNGAELVEYTDGERLFYGKLLPYHGFAHTNSLNNTTDSAASATALASGYKTTNGRVGRDAEGKDLFTLTELAGSMGMATAVMSTEVQTGATPAGFSAHADDRDDTDDISASQKALQEKYGTVIEGDFDFYDPYGVYQLEQRIVTTLDTLDDNEKGFFMMYEEAYIDKHSHAVDLEKTAAAVLRFNQAIARFMEYAFYHPDTFLIITADHETGGLYVLEDQLKFNSGGHTGRDVPVYAYGVGAEVFDGKTVENVQIPKTIAAMWGKKLAEDTDDQYPVLK